MTQRIEVPQIALAEALAVTVEVIVGQAHVGDYRLVLWHGSDHREVARGTNIDSVADQFSLGSPDDLDGRVLGCELYIQAAAAKAGQVYSASILVRQDGKVCDGGLIERAGTFEDVHYSRDYRRFRKAS